MGKSKEKEKPKKPRVDVQTDDGEGTKPLDPPKGDPPG